MPVTLMGLDAQLPRTHCFISIAHGRSIRTIRVRMGLFRAAIGLAALLVCWLVGATLYLACHDDLVASLMAREARTQYAYEDRIAALRSQVEHESSVSLVGQSTLEGRMRELTLRAKSLEMRASLVAQAGQRTGIAIPFDRAPNVIRQARGLIEHGPALPIPVRQAVGTCHPEPVVAIGNHAAD